MSEPFPVGLKVLRPGAYSTIQDEGRFGWRSKGVSPGGAFDLGSHALANALLGNARDAATVEMTMWGAKWEVVGEPSSSIAVAWAGASMSSVWLRGGVDRVVLPNAPQTLELRVGDVLDFGTAQDGLRTYLAVQGGFQTPLLLGARSQESPLTIHEVLPCGVSRTLRRQLQTSAVASSQEPIRLVSGPDPGPSLIKARITSRINRTGLRIEMIEADGDSDLAWSGLKLSAPLDKGAIQWLGGRDAIILGAGCGTMGGYPHVAHVISPDLDRLAQLRPGDCPRFVTLDIERARTLDREDRELREYWLEGIARNARIELVDRKEIR